MEVKNTKINVEGNINEKESTFNFKNILSSILQIIATFLVCTFIFNCVILYGYVPTGSMESTIDSESYIIANRLNKNYERFDIVVFDFNQEGTEKLFVKRIIGMPNDTILLKDNKVYVNGEEIKESYLKEDMYFPDEVEYKVPEGYYFMLGDNRNNSLDSRYWDYPYVSEDEIKGPVIFNFKFKDDFYIKSPK